MKNKKGISMIVLVVTIIVILILSSAIIITVNSNGGLINKSKKAKKNVNFDTLKDEIEVIMSNRSFENEMDVYTSLKEDLENKLNGSKVIEEVTPHVFYVTRDGLTVTVYDDGEIIQGKLDVWDGKKKTKPKVDENKNWHIYTTGELNYFKEFVNQKLTAEEMQGLEITDKTIVYLENDLDLGAKEETGELVRGTKWDGIGISKDVKFIGTFDGQNHYIRGVYYNENLVGNGLFRRAYSIKNLIIKDSYIAGNGATGGVVGSCEYISNCHNINTIVILKEGNNYAVGGVAAQVIKEIKDSTNNGKVIAYGYEISKYASYCGGVVGAAINNVTNCKNNGEIYSNGMNTSGIVGRLYSDTNVTNCINNGNVNSKNSRVGGIAGEVTSNSNISNCINNGNVKSDNMYVGGIVGIAVNNSNILSSINNGNIEGNTQVGGIVGNTSTNSNILNSINNGNVKSDNMYAGGIAGVSLNNIENCINNGKVSSNNMNVGGIVGLLGGNIDKCINKANIEGNAQVGGICGQIGTKCNANIKNCANSGLVKAYNNITDTSDVAALGGIIGWISKTETSGSILNNYNIGKLEVENKNNVKDVGGIIGHNVTTNFNIANNYYLTGISDLIDNNFGDVKTEQEFKENQIIDLLNTGLAEPVWQKDINNKNNGYPMIIGIEY